ncbi:hypothetical protein ZMO02_12770 [Zymomonas mobilis subsp. pomaceae]|nr:hypothetical protein ZMO02_12770 [Zymomonas mobilis subsp. pomaceae]
MAALLAILVTIHSPKSEDFYIFIPLQKTGVNAVSIKGKYIVRRTTKTEKNNRVERLPFGFMDFLD